MGRHCACFYTGLAGPLVRHVAVAPWMSFSVSWASATINETWEMREQRMRLLRENYYYQALDSVEMIFRFRDICLLFGKLLSRSYLKQAAGLSPPPTTSSARQFFMFFGKI